MMVRYKILEILKEQPGFISGSNIGEKLNISRAAVAKHIDVLREEGYEISSVQNRGHKLIAEGDILNPNEVDRALTTKFIGREIFSQRQVKSTNDLLKSNAEKGCKDGALCICEEQRLGRGRRGRSWTLEPKAGIAFSIVLRPDFAPELAPNLTLLMGLAVNKALRSLCGAESKIKWPNDIIINGKKVCGILVEMITEERDIKYVICGVGINVSNKEFPEDLKNIATSIYIETGKAFLRKDVLAAVLNNFEELYIAYCENVSFAPFLEEYKASCINIGRELKAVYDNKEIIAAGEDIAADGSLIVRQNDGSLLTLRSGEVSIRGVFQ